MTAVREGCREKGRSPGRNLGLPRLALMHSAIDLVADFVSP